MEAEFGFLHKWRAADQLSTMISLVVCEPRNDLPIKVAFEVIHGIRQNLDFPTTQTQILLLGEVEF